MRRLGDVDGRASVARALCQPLRGTFGVSPHIRDIRSHVLDLICGPRIWQPGGRGGGILEQASTRAPTGRPGFR
jgi:hypothetical protein